VVAVAEKVTVRFEEFDNDLDGNIVSSGPLVLYKTVNTINELILLPQSYGFPAKTPTSTPNVVVFVKRVTGYSADDPNNRGAYFKYNYETTSWQEILLGTHSHENKEFLDKLGQFALNKDNIGETYLTLNISAGDVDGNGNPLSYEYDIDWKPIPDNVLPEVPESENNMYLRVDSEGNKAWVNDFVAAQTFNVKKQIVSLGSGSESTNTFIFNDVSYNESLGDYALVWSDTFLVADKTITYNEITRQLTVVSSTVQFNNNEYATLMIIRNGAAAAIAELAEDYVTKGELINVLSGGQVNLRDYATKTDLNAYAKRQHSHADLAKRNHNHDNRYAFYFHTHPEIAEQIDAKISTYVGLHPEVVNILSNISTIIENNTELQSLIETLNFGEDLNLINEKLDALNGMFNDQGTSPINVQLKGYLNNRRFNSFQIDTTYVNPQGEIQNLEEILTDIYEKLEFENEIVNTDEVRLSEDIEVKLADGVEIGRYVNGNVIDANTELTDILSNMLRKQIVPEYIKPQLNITWNVNLLPEVGSSVSLSVIPTAPTLNHNEKIQNYRLIKKVVGETTEEQLKNSSTLTNSAFSGTVSLLNIVEGGSVEIYAIADYIDVDDIVDNFGVSYIQPDGTTDKVSRIITPKRALIISPRTVVLPTLNGLLPAQASALIRAGSTSIVRDSYTTIDETFIVPVGTRSIIFALPKSEGELTKVLYKEQGDIDIKDLFDVEVYLVEGANGYTSVEYNVYTYEFGRVNESPLTLRFIKE